MITDTGHDITFTFTDEEYELLEEIAKLNEYTNVWDFLEGVIERAILEDSRLFKKKKPYKTNQEL